MLFLHFFHNFLNISAMLQIKVLSYGENMMNILRTKAMLNFALSLIPKGGKKCTFHLSSFENAHFDQK